MPKYIQFLRKRHTMIDLHCHSTASDGSCSPARLVAEAERIGLKALALTDHDTTAGLSEFMAAGSGSTVETIPGIELAACDENNRNLSFHIVGLFIREHSPQLDALLKQVIAWRIERNLAIVSKLSEMGFPITIDEVQDLAGQAVIGRPHIAMILLDKGIVTSLQNAFDRLLSTGKPGYVFRRVPTPLQTISAIHSAGGIAVWAHPFTRGNYTNMQMRRIAVTLKDMGLDGMEAYYPLHTATQVRTALDICKGLALAPSGGSDFHGLRKSDIALGTGKGKLCVPDDLLAGLRNVWAERSAAAE